MSFKTNFPCNKDPKRTDDQRRQLQAGDKRAKRSKTGVRSENLILWLLKLHELHQAGFMSSFLLLVARLRSALWEKINDRNDQDQPSVMSAAQIYRSEHVDPGRRPQPR